MKTAAAIVAMAAASATAIEYHGDQSMYGRVTGAPFGYKAGSHESISNMKKQVKNVVWLLLENRSFDNILGGVKRDGLDNPANFGDMCMPQNVTEMNSPTWCTRKKDFDSVLNDPDHSVTGNCLEWYDEFVPNNAKIANGRLTPEMKGFVDKQLISYPTLTPEVAAEQVLGYYSESEIPTLVDLVDEFALFNYWFSCIPGPTNPNRMCALAGTSAGHGTNDNDFLVHAIDTYSIFEAATEKGVSWLNYDGTNGAFAPDALFFNWTFENAPNQVVPIENFFQDAYLGELPQLSYLNPSCCGLNTNSMHPTGNVSYGQVFVKQVYEALRNGPQWEETILILTFDETGGFHDHVPPPLAVRPDDLTYTEPAANGQKYTLDFNRYGGRMPTWLISPHTPKGFVENFGVNPKTGDPEPYSATSVLKTIGYLFGIDDFTPRVANSPSFDHLIGPKARSNCPTVLTTPKTFANAV